MNISDVSMEDKLNKNQNNNDSELIVEKNNDKSLDNDNDGK